ncbi:MAG: hypothetical protein ACI85I_001452 [Arenicella sp.]|jgi:hypothetical protein
MNTKDKLAFCAICENKKFTSPIRTMVCGLTELPANFKHDCSGFQLDIEAKERKLSKVKSKIEKSIKSQRSLLDTVVLELPMYEFLPKSSNFHFYNSRVKSVTFHDDKKKRTHLLLGGLAFIFIGVLVIIYVSMNYYKLVSYLGPILLLGIGVIEMYRFFNTTKIKITPNELSVNAKDRFEWRHILFLYFYKVRSGNVITDYLIIHLNDSSERKINISRLRISKVELGKALYISMKNFKIN